MERFGTFEGVIVWLKQYDRPCIALEGSREVPEDVALLMEQVARRLVAAVPNLIVRSGNAEGSDLAWAKGVNAVNPERLELFVPQTKPPKRNIVAGNRVVTLTDVAEDFMEYATALSCDNYLSIDGRLKGKAAWEKLRPWQKKYLVRDVFKVTGVPLGGEAASITNLALLYINSSKKNGGGTGHTKRICESLGVPVIEREVWKHYVTEIG